MTTDLRGIKRCFISFFRYNKNLKHISIKLVREFIVLFGKELKDCKNCVSTKSDDDRRRDNSSVYIVRVFAPKCETSAFVDLVKWFVRAIKCCQFYETEQYFWQCCINCIDTENYCANIDTDASWNFLIEKKAIWLSTDRRCIKCFYG